MYIKLKNYFRRLSQYAGVPVHISAYIVDTNSGDSPAPCDDNHDQDNESDSGISDTNHDSDQVLQYVKIELVESELNKEIKRYPEIM